MPPGSYLLQHNRQASMPVESLRPTIGSCAVSNNSLVQPGIWHVPELECDIECHSSTALWCRVCFLTPIPSSMLNACIDCNFSPGSQGLIFISPLIGSLIGTYLCGPIADQVATFFTTRNHGIREPEMRCVVAAVLTFLGALFSGLITTKRIGPRLLLALMFYQQGHRWVPPWRFPTQSIAIKRYVQIPGQRKKKSILIK